MFKKTGGKRLARVSLLLIEFEFFYLFEMKLKLTWLPVLKPSSHTIQHTGHQLDIL